jgi:dolichyl-phosphate-mannose--protein O-mannosyl transferase
MTQTAARALAPRPAAPAPRPASWAGSEAFWAWTGPLIVMLIGGLQRFWRLGTPRALVFDETYYAKEAASYLRYGYELAPVPAPPRSPDPFVLGHGDVFGTTGEFVVHPPVGKWMIAAGEWLFGPASPAGWRFAAAGCGTLAILMIGRIAFRLFGSALLATTAALLLACDGEEFVHSRTGILDIFVMFWALAAFGCLLIDRDRARARLTARVAGQRVAGQRVAGQAGPWVAGRFGPWLGPRWWRVGGIACLTLCTGVKWSGIYFAAVFLTLSVLGDLAARRRAGVPRWVLGGVLADGVQAFATSIVVIPAGYVATWSGWLAGSRGWDRQWGAQHPAAPGWGWVPSALRSLWQYHAEMWHFHLTLHTPHPYMANPWAWPVLGRPTAFFYANHASGHVGCHTGTCSQEILALGNPAIWYGGVLAAGVLLFRWLLARDGRAGAILAGIAAGYLPWFLYQGRTVFAFYAVAFVPWVVLGVSYCLGLLLGPRDGPARRRRRGALAAGSYVFAVVTLFWFFYPVLAARVIPHTDWLLRMWMPSWI